MKDRFEKENPSVYLGLGTNKMPYYVGRQESLHKITNSFQNVLFQAFLAGPSCSIHQKRQ